MRLTDLNPKWVGHGGEGVTYKGVPVPRREGVSISFDCPCGDKDKCRPCTIIFKNPLDGGPSIYPDHAWDRTGDTFETLSLLPSIQRLDGCKWHGHITKGEIKTV